MAVLRAFFGFSCIAVLLGLPPPAAAEPPLTLAEAERLALARAPQLAHHRTNVAASAARAG